MQLHIISDNLSPTTIWRLTTRVKGQQKWVLQRSNKVTVVTPPEVEGTCQQRRPCAPELVERSYQRNCSSVALSGFCVECPPLKRHLEHLRPLLPPQPFQVSPAAAVVQAPAVFCWEKRAFQSAFGTWSVSPWMKTKLLGNQLQVLSFWGCLGRQTPTAITTFSHRGAPANSELLSLFRISLVY